MEDTRIVVIILGFKCRWVVNLLIRRARLSWLDQLEQVTGLKLGDFDIEEY